MGFSIRRTIVQMTLVDYFKMVCRYLASNFGFNLLVQ